MSTLHELIHIFYYPTTEKLMKATYYKIYLKAKKMEKQ